MTGSTVDRSEGAEFPPDVVGAGSYDGFLSYARSDLRAATELREALAEREKRLWVDTANIPAASEWRTRIARGIEACKSFVFLLSPDSLSSQSCAEELRQAIALSKLIIPVYRREVDEQAVPAVLADAEWVFLRDGDEFQSGLDRLVDALDADLDWRDRHTRLAGRAREWRDSGRDKSFLLRGSDLGAAEDWLSEQADHRQPATAEQAEYIVHSRRAAVGRQRRLLVSVLGGIAITLALAVIAVIQRNLAIANQHTAVSRELAALATADLSQRPEVSLGLALAALKTKPTSEAVAAFLRAAASNRLVMTLQANSRRINAVAFNSDGSMAVTGGNDGVVRIWSLAGPPKMVALPGHGPAPILSAAFSRDGRMVAGGDWSGTLRVWHLESGRKPLVLATHAQGVTSAAFVLDDRALITGSWDETVRIWSLRPPYRSRVLLRSVNAARVVPSRDGYYLASASTRTGMISVWHGTSNQLTLVARRRTQSEINALASSRGATLLAAGGADGSIEVWNLRNRGPGRFVQTHGSPILGLVLDRQTNELAASNVEGQVRIWTVTGGPRTTLYGDEGPLYDLASSPNGEEIMAGGDQGSARIWTLATNPIPLHTAKLGRSALTHISASSNGRFLVTSAQDGHVTILRSSDLKPVVSLRGLSGNHVTTARFDNTGARVIAGTYEGTVTMWLVAHPAHAMTLVTGTSPIESAALSPNDRQLAASDLDGQVVLLDVGQGGPRHILNAGTDEISDVAFSPDDQRLAAAGYIDQELRIWTLSDLRHPIVVNAHQGPLTSIAFSPNSHDLLSAGDQGTVDVWDAGTGKQLAQLSGGSRSIRAAAFSADGQWIIAAGDDGAVRAWHWRTPDSDATPVTLSVGQTPLTSVTFVAGGPTFVASGANGTVELGTCRPCATISSLVSSQAENLRDQLTFQERAYIDHQSGFLAS